MLRIKIKTNKQKNFWVTPEMKLEDEKGILKKTKNKQKKCSKEGGKVESTGR